MATIVCTAPSRVPYTTSVFNGSMSASSAAGTCWFASFANALTAGMPDKTTGFLYVNLASALPLLQTVGPFLGLSLPPTLETDAGALRSLIAYGTRSGDEAGLTAFLQVR